MTDQKQTLQDTKDSAAPQETENGAARDVSIPLEGGYNFTRLLCEAGKNVFEKGMPSHQVYYVESGRVEVIVEDDEDHPVKLAELGPGEVFGEMGVLENEERMATVRALEKSHILVIKRIDIEERLKDIEDPVIKALIRGLTARLRQTSESHVHQARHMVKFQDRIYGLMDKANEGIDKSQRADFADEIEPLLAKIEDILDKYQR